MELYNGNCIEVMKEMISKGRKFDKIITSPPYNMCLRVHTGKYMSRWGWKEEHSLGAKYDNYADDLPMDEYFKFQDEFISLGLQLTDLMFYNIQMVTGNKIALLQLLGKHAEKVKEIIIWDKCYGQPAMNPGVLNSQFEFLFVFQNTKPYNRSFDEAKFERGTETNVWNIQREKNQYIKAGFPSELVARILRDFTEEEETILDPFMGSGTTGIVCQRLKRKFVGIELDKDMFEIAQRRIKEEGMKKRLF